MDQHRIPLVASMNSCVLESNLIPELERAVVSTLYAFNKMFTVYDAEPDNRQELGIVMHMQQRKLCAKFWRFIGAA
jgi:hypothetical protein